MSFLPSRKDPHDYHATYQYRQDQSNHRPRDNQRYYSNNHRNAYQQSSFPAYSHFLQRSSDPYRTDPHPDYTQAGKPPPRARKRANRPDSSPSDPSDLASRIDFVICQEMKNAFFLNWTSELPTHWLDQDTESLACVSEIADQSMLAKTWASKDRLDLLFDLGFGATFYAARNRCFPTDTKGSNKFSNRAGDKLQTVLQFLRIEPPKDEKVFFIDLCGGPGAFSQYFLRRGPSNEGYGMTLLSETAVKNSLSWYPALLKHRRFQIVVGETKDGNIYKPENMVDLVRVSQPDVHRISYVVADGGFGIRAKTLETGVIVHQENLQELFSIRIILSELLGALLTLGSKGNFVCKVCCCCCFLKKKLA